MSLGVWLGGEIGVAGRGDRCGWEGRGEMEGDHYCWLWLGTG